MSITDQEALDAIMRQDLSIFTRKVFHTVDPTTAYLHNWHIDYICEYLEACTAGEITRLIINMPPRFMKSLCVSVAWPAWILGRNPAERIMAASYNQTLSDTLSRKCRLVLGSHWYKRIFPAIEITKDTERRFDTSRSGFRFSTSVGGSATGEGGNFLIVDDALHPLETASKKKRETANEWFDQTFSTRLNDKKRGVIVVVMQRLHEEDLSGHLLKVAGWENIKIPLIAEQKTIVQMPRSGRIIVREEGDLLHPARMGPEEIEKEKGQIGEYGFYAQYQQEPAPSGGGIYKREWFREYENIDDVPLGKRTIVQSWDCAYKPEQINDPSCCTTWLMTDDLCYLLHVLVKRLTYPQLKAEAITHAALWGVDTILIEDKASGQSLIQDMRVETKYPIVAIEPCGDKLTRASVVSPTVERGCVVIPTNQAWTYNYLHEMLTFPNATHDDQVDSTSQFLSWRSKIKKTVRQPGIRSL